MNICRQKEKLYGYLSEADGVIARVAGLLRGAVAGGQHVVEMALHDGLLHAGVVTLGLLSNFLGKVSALLFRPGASLFAAVQAGFLGIVADGLEGFRGEILFRDDGGSHGHGCGESNQGENRKSFHAVENDIVSIDDVLRMSSSFLSVRGTLLQKISSDRHPAC